MVRFPGIILLCMLTVSGVAQAKEAKNSSPTLADLVREFSVCQTVYQSTQKTDFFINCRSQVFDKYDAAISAVRESKNYVHKEKWTAINTTLNKQFEQCEKVAISSQTSSTILYEQTSCYHTRYRGLLFEALRLNQSAIN